MRFSFPGTARLDARGVETVLQAGIRLRGKTGSPWLLRIHPVAGPAKLAISVPKRWIKSAVARNLLKRQAREAFRHHAIRLLPAHLLASVVTACETGEPATRRMSRNTLVQLLDQAAARMSVAPAARISISPAAGEA